MEAIAGRLKAVAIGLEAIASRVIWSLLLELLQTPGSAVAVVGRVA